jgi:hypothetical protein
MPSVQSASALPFIEVAPKPASKPQVEQMAPNVEVAPIVEVETQFRYLNLFYP